MRLWKKGRSKGVTLAETLVVVVTVAILAAVAVPSFSNYVSKAKEEVYRSEAEKVYLAAQFYSMEEYAAGTLSRTKMRKDLLEFQIGDPRHALTKPLDGCYTAGARITSVAATDMGECKAITYEVLEYRIVVRKGLDAVLSKKE